MSTTRRDAATAASVSTSRKPKRKHGGASGTVTRLYQILEHRKGSVEVRSWPYVSMRRACRAIGLSSTQRYLKAQIQSNGQRFSVFFDDNGAKTMSKEEVLGRMGTLKASEHTTILQTVAPWMDGYNSSMSSAVKEKAVSASRKRHSPSVRMGGSAVYVHMLDSETGTRMIGSTKYRSLVNCTDRLGVTLPSDFSRGKGVLRIFVRSDQTFGQPPSKTPGKPNWPLKCNSIRIWLSTTNYNTRDGVAKVQTLAAEAYERREVVVTELERPPSWVDDYWKGNCKVLESIEAEEREAEKAEQEDARTLFPEL